MIDYIFRFADEAAAIAALPDHGSHDEDSVWRWNGSYAMPVKVIVGYEDGGTDPETGAAITLPVYAESYFVAIASRERDADLWAIPECVSESDRAMAAADPSSGWLLNTRLTDAELAGSTVTPTWAGSNYPWGS
jgi:hypothetical protein